MEKDEIYGAVSKKYSEASKSTSVRYGESVAKSFGYTEEELASIPKDSNLGVSCGNPIALATLRLGETVIDLGSGAGFDVFLAANKVGPAGKVIGVDMNEDMLARANALKSPTVHAHVAFLHARLTAVPLPAGAADCVLSNCVLNLVPAADKPAAFAEMHRLLRPGGRLALSDILLRKPLPPRLRESVALYTGCVAGASLVGEYEAYLRAAGFDEIVLADTDADLNVYTNTNEDDTMKDTSCCGVEPEEPDSRGCCAATSEKSLVEALKGIDLNEWAGSYKIFAVKS